MKNVKLYVGTYQKYNNGSIQGKWLDLSDYEDINEFYKACKELHKDESDPEFMFQDFESPELLSNFISEGYLSKDIYEAIELFEGNDNIDLYEAFAEINDTPDNLDGLKDLITNAEDSFCGEFESDKDFAQNFADEMGYLESPITLLYDNINWEGVATDLMNDFSQSSGFYFSHNY